MAKSPAPFMSINPSGSIAGLLTASRWKGRPYLRLLVTPSNPQTAAQQHVREHLGVLAKAARAVLTSFSDSVGVGSPFFTAARDQAPSGQSWISFMQSVIASIMPTAVGDGFGALSGTVQGYFENTATDIGLVVYEPAWLTDDDATVLSAAGQLYALAYFASNYLTGSIKTLADLAIAGANQTAVDNFGDAVHLTTP